MQGLIEMGAAAELDVKAKRNESRESRKLADLEISQGGNSRQAVGSLVE